MSSLSILGQRPDQRPYCGR